jgi:hypothetical protein
MSTNFLILYQYPHLSTKVSARADLSVNSSASATASAKINYQLRINIITQYKTNHILGSCLIDDIVKFKWSRWKYNRPPDMIRVEEIVQYIERGNSIDWLLYFIYSDNGDKLSCLSIYDGLHRMSAISEYIKQFERQQGIRCPLRDSTIVISIRINPTLGEIVDAFEVINKSVPVPFLEHIGIDAQDSKRRDIIEEVVEKWQKRYKRHFKSTVRTNIPNINRDTFMDIVNKLYDVYNINEDKKKLEMVLKCINDYMQDINVLPNNTFSEKAIIKCRDTGCYLFLVKSNMLFEFIESSSITIT